MQYQIVYRIESETLQGAIEQTKLKEVDPVNVTKQERPAVRPTPAVAAPKPQGPSSP